LGVISASPQRDFHWGLASRQGYGILPNKNQYSHNGKSRERDKFESMKPHIPSAVLKSTLLIAAGILALVGCKPKAPELSLVKDGKPQATIVIAKEPSKTTLFAVQELTMSISSSLPARSFPWSMIRRR
jgi:hypothetical protein